MKIKLVRINYDYLYGAPSHLKRHYHKTSWMVEQKADKILDTLKNWYGGKKRDFHYNFEYDEQVLSEEEVKELIAYGYGHKYGFSYRQ